MSLSEWRSLPDAPISYLAQIFSINNSNFILIGATARDTNTSCIYKYNAMTKWTKLMDLNDVLWSRSFYAGIDANNQSVYISDSNSNLFRVDLTNKTVTKLLTDPNLGKVPLVLCTKDTVHILGCWQGRGQNKHGILEQDTNTKYMIKPMHDLNNVVSKHFGFSRIILNQKIVFYHHHKK